MSLRVLQREGPFPEAHTLALLKQRPARAHQEEVVHVTTSQQGPECMLFAPVACACLQLAARSR